MKKIIFFIIFFILTQIQIYSQEPAFELSREGKTTKKQINSGQIHKYSINLNIGEFIFIEIEQMGVDVNVELVDPNGITVAKINTPDLVYYTEPLYWTTKVAGTHLIAISATTNSTNENYSIKVGMLRQSVESDKHYLEGQNFFAQGDELRTKNEKGSFAKAIVCYENSISAWNHVFQNERVGICLNLIGEINYYIGNINEAIEYISKASELLNSSAKAQCFNNLGHLYFFSGQREKALNAFNTSLKINELSNDKTITINALNGLANVQLSFGRTENALKTLYSVINLANQIGHQTEFATAAHNIGSILGNLGEKEESLKFFNQALSIWREKGIFVNEVSTLNAIGASYLEIKDFDSADEIYNNVIELTLKTGQEREKGIALFGLGYTKYLKQEYRKSLELYQLALDLFVKSNATVYKSLVLRLTGLTYTKLEQYEEAVKNYTEAYELAKQTDLLSAGQSLYRRAELYQIVNKPELAINDVMESLKVYETRQETNNYQLKIFQSATLNDIYKLYISILMDLHKKDASKKYDVLAFEIHEKSRAEVLNNLIVEKQLNLRQNVDQQLIDEEMQANQKIVEKSAELKEININANSSKTKKVNVEKELSLLTIELNQIQAKIRENNPQYGLLKNTKALCLSEVQDFLDKSATLIQYSLGKEQTHLFVITNNTFDSYILPSAGEIEAIANDVLTLFRNPPIKGKTNLAIKDQEKKLQESLAKLSELLLGECISKLNTEKILIVGDGFLGQFPFSALIKPGKSYPMVLDYEMTNASSVSTLKLLANYTSNAVSNSVLIISDPILDLNDTRLLTAAKRNKSKLLLGTDQTKISALVSQQLERTGLERLSFAAQEADNIAATFSESTQILSGVNATLEKFLSLDLVNAKILHFITHGFIDHNKPELSGLVLSLVNVNGEIKRSYLTAQNITNLKLNTDLVVLSACHTSFGKQVVSEGSIGLAYSFISAGSKRVLSTLWPINDKSTSILMSNFYTEMKKNRLNPSAALRKAQIFMLKTKEWNAPYYWAPFQLQGNF